MTAAPPGHGRLESRVEMLEAVLMERERAFGRDHLFTLIAASDLGTSYIGEGRLGDADAMLSWAFTGLEKAQERDDVIACHVANNLGAVYASQGRVKEAEETYERALGSMQTVLGPHHALTLNTVSNLGLLYKDRGRFDDAEAMYERALQGFERIYGNAHTSTLTTVNGFGMVYRHQGRLNEAENMFQRALQGFEEVVGPDHTSTLDVVNNLENIYIHQARHTEAEHMYQRAKAGFEQSQGWDHRSTLNAANNLRLLYVEQGRLDEAEEIAGWVREQNRRHGGNSLHRAARNGHIDMLRLLLVHGVDINAKSEHDWYSPAGEPMGSTALHIAVYHGYIGAVKELLIWEADVNAVCHWDPITPLNVAAERNHRDIARILLDNSADINGVGGAGRPPLLDAAIGGHMEMAKLLLHGSAEVDATDTDGDPVLHSAAYCNHLNIVGLLLDHGANPRAKGGSGRTARWFAAEKGHEAIVQLLRSRGADDLDEPDMFDDSSVTLQLVGEDKLLAAMEKAQALISSEPVGEQWVRQLRFVVRSTNQQYDLEIIQEDPSSPQEDFIAVSYCWGLVSSPINQKVLTIHDPGRDYSPRPTRASSDIIQRSLDFTASRNIHRIWIDQECIDQDNETDVQAAIQAMHLVYRLAKATVVILGKHIHSLEDLNTLSHPKTMFQSTSSGSTDQILRDRILGDKWFTRAWCAQERVNSNPASLYFLVGSRHDVDEDGQAWMICAERHNLLANQLKQELFREWVLTSGDVWAMSFHGPRNNHVMLSNVYIKAIGATSVTFTALDENLEGMAWYRPNSEVGRYSSPRLNLT